MLQASFIAVVVLRGRAQVESNSFCINTFGGLSLAKSSGLFAPKLGRTSCEIFTFLAMQNGKPVGRDKLAERFWPSQSSKKSRSALNTSIWRLSQAIASWDIEKLISLERTDETLRLDITNVKEALDCQNLVTCVKQIEFSDNDAVLSHGQKISALEKALERYTDSFLPTHESDWVMQERERLRCIYIRGCQIMMSHCVNMRCFERALSYGRKIMAQDDLRENTLRQIIWLHVMNGERHIAIQKYLSFQIKLREELSVDVMPDTLSLYESIIDNSLPPLEHGASMPLNTPDHLEQLAAYRYSIFERL